jgi:hypothetical protein
MEREVQKWGSVGFWGCFTLLYINVIHFPDIFPRKEETIPKPHLTPLSDYALVSLHSG